MIKVPRNDMWPNSPEQILSNNVANTIVLAISNENYQEIIMSNDNAQEKKRDSLPGSQACVCKGDLCCIFSSIWEVSGSSRSHKEPTMELCILIYKVN